MEGFSSSRQESGNDDDSQEEYSEERPVEKTPPPIKRSLFGGMFGSEAPKQSGVNAEAGPPPKSSIAELFGIKPEEDDDDDPEGDEENDDSTEVAAGQNEDDLASAHEVTEGTQGVSTQLETPEPEEALANAEVVEKSTAADSEYQTAPVIHESENHNEAKDNLLGELKIPHPEHIPQIEENTILDTSFAQMNSERPVFTEPNRLGPLPSEIQTNPTDYTSSDEPEDTLVSNTIVTPPSVSSVSAAPNTSPFGPNTPQSISPNAPQGSFGAPVPPLGGNNAPPPGSYNYYPGSNQLQPNAVPITTLNPNMVTNTKNVLVGHERPHTHPGIISALILSHLIGRYRTNELRRDMEKADVRFKKQLEEISARQLQAEQETERRKLQEEERLRASTAEAAGAYPAEATAGTVGLNAAQKAEQRPGASSEIVSKQNVDYISQDQTKEELGVISPDRGSVGTIESNPLRQQTGEYGMTSREEAVRWTEKNKEQRNEQFDSPQRDLPGAISSDQVSHSILPSLSPQRDARSMAEAQAIMEMQVDDIPKSSLMKTYSKPIVGGFVAGLIVLGLAMAAVYLMR